MSTYLQLCQRLASESGTIAGTQPTTVSSQTGRLAKIVRWVNDAWRTIQTTHDTWRWMESDFSGPTIASQRDYSGSDFGVSSRFGRFLVTGDEHEDRYSIYDPDIGVSDEGRLRFLPWRQFYTSQMRGTQTNNKPYWFTIHPSGALYLHPIPDKVYTVRGPYMKDVQELTANGDTPEMPSRFHDLIVEVALEYLGTHDESPNQLPLWKLREMRRFGDLERDQLETMQIPGPLA